MTVTQCFFDPRQTRITQTLMSEKKGFTFAKGLRALVRQDPDIIMVGEIRDLETATVAIQSALTGHLVLSTLHTNDAPSSVTRLLDLGVEPFLAASSVIAAVLVVAVQSATQAMTNTARKQAEIGIYEVLFQRFAEIFRTDLQG